MKVESWIKNFFIEKWYEWKRIVDDEVIKTNYYLKKWAFPEINCTPPCWGYWFFWNWPPWISSQIYLDSPGIFHSFALTPSPWKFMFFPQFLVYPPGIPVTFTHLLSIEILNRGRLQFFSGKAQWRNNDRLLLFYARTYNGLSSHHTTVIIYFCSFIKKK